MIIKIVRFIFWVFNYDLEFSDSIGLETGWYDGNLNHRWIATTIAIKRNGKTVRLRDKLSDLGGVTLAGHGARGKTKSRAALRLLKYRILGGEKPLIEDKNYQTYLDDEAKK